MSENSSSTCRICLSLSNSNVSLFKSINGSIYNNLLKDYTGIELLPKDDLPCGLCNACLSELLTVTKFISKILLANEKLNQIQKWNIPSVFLNSVKCEGPEVIVNICSENEFKDEKEESSNLKSPNVDERRKIEECCNTETEQFSNFESNFKNTEKKSVIHRKTKRKKALDSESISDCKSSSNSNIDKLTTNEYSLRTRSKVYNNYEDYLSYVNDDELHKKKSSSLVSINFTEDSVETEKGFDPRCVILKKCKEKGLRKDVVKCLTCGVLSINKSAFLVHYRKHSGERPHKCPHCATGFTQIGTLNTHLKRRHPKEWIKMRMIARKLKRLREKDRLERSDRDLSVKNNGVSQTNERCFTCNVCGKNYYRRSSLATHMRHHNVDRQFQCPYCPQKFVQSGMRSLHVRVHHTGERPFCCHVCGKSFVASTALTKHLVSHSEERKFKCEICDKSMKSKDNLKRHILVMHTPAKRKVCDICGATFALTYKLNHHIKVWHINKRSGECDVCKKSFNNIDKHMRRHSGDKPHGCDMCHKTFFKQKNLIEHVKKHQNENATFKCTYESCTSMFSKKCVLDFHVLKYHLKHTPYVCQYCSRGFYRKRDLGKHMKAIHNVKLEFSITN